MTCAIRDDRRRARGEPAHVLDVRTQRGSEGERCERSGLIGREDSLRAVHDRRRHRQRRERLAGLVRIGERERGQDVCERAELIQWPRRSCRPTASACDNHIDRRAAALLQVQFRGHAIERRPGRLRHARQRAGEQRHDRERDQQLDDGESCEPGPPQGDVRTRIMAASFESPRGTPRRTDGSRPTPAA